MGISETNRDDRFDEPVLDDDAFCEEPCEDELRSFTVSGKRYVISLTKHRLDLYEQRHRPIMASLIKNDGAFSAAELTALLAYGLRLEGGPFVKPQRGIEMAERLIQSSGYICVYEAVIEALERDCGFLFRGA